MDEEPPASLKECVGHKCVEMRVETVVFAKGVDGQSCVGKAIGQLQYFSLVIDQAVAGTAKIV